MEGKAEKREISQDLEAVLVRVNKDSQSTQDIHITKNEFTIGRSLQCDFIFKNINISRQHCIVKFTADEQWSIINCSGVNPIYINNKPLNKDEIHNLQVGDIVHLNPDEDFKYVFALNIKSGPITKRPRLEEKLLDDVINEQKTFMNEQEAKRKELEDQLQIKQREQNSLKEELERLRKEKEITQELNKQIEILEQKIESGNEVEKDLHGKYRNLLDRLEEEKKLFEEKLADEKQKWEEALNASKQEKEILEVNLREQMEEWKVKQDEEWKTKLNSVVNEEKNAQDKLLTEKNLLEQKLKEMEETLKQKEMAVAISPQNIIEAPVDLLDNMIVVQLAQGSHSGTPNKLNILDTIDLTLDTPRTSFVEQANREIFNKVENIMDDQLTCSICSELFVKAMTTNCMHTFCHHCIMIWFTKSEGYICPVCRRTIINMTRSLVIDNFIEKMTENLPPDSRNRRMKFVNERIAVTRKTRYPTFQKSQKRK
ncbi:E3 ubiquitin-protein ligase rnf8-A-like [Leptopilina heterotoma]|uniref:E3 ubiquitin-protein ligase rnf8-A-like n=1 Tax=Leptopilina heterotoma TaxID=63436 RepID=UPI001CAA10EC|nr:E3 ubiquitin-protein ligase rnf8-A-like [Leptopilina heterotoma]